MSTYTTMVDCPHVRFENGKPVCCSAEIEIEYEVDGHFVAPTWDDDGDAPSLIVLSDLVAIVCDHEDEPEPLAPNEVTELDRLVERAMDRELDNLREEQEPPRWRELERQRRRLA